MLRSTLTVFDVDCSNVLPEASVATIVIPFVKVVSDTTNQKFVAVSAESPSVTPSPQSSVIVVVASAPISTDGTPSNEPTMVAEPAIGSPLLPRNTIFEIVASPYILILRKPPTFLNARNVSSTLLVTATMVFAPTPNEFGA